MTGTLTESRRLRLLANRSRRTIITVLQERGGPLPVDEVVDVLARRVYEESSTATRRTAHVELYHNHLPKLEAVDVVSYDPEDRTIRLHTDGDLLTRPIDPSNDGPSHSIDA